MITKPSTGKTSVTKYLKIAAPLAAAAALVATGLATGSSSAAKSGGTDKDAPSYGTTAKAAKAGGVTKCDGGVQKKVWDRGAAGWQYATSDGGSLTLPGSVIRIKGPSSGKDVLSVNLSALSYLSSGSTGYAQVILDGTPMKPSDVSTGTYYVDDFDDNYGTFAQNYCRKIGPGYHNFKVVLIDNDGGAAGNYYFELHDPMVHLELSE
jgi:hypothetical protein